MICRDFKMVQNCGLGSWNKFRFGKLADGLNGRRARKVSVLFGIENFLNNRTIFLGKNKKSASLQLQKQQLKKKKKQAPTSCQVLIEWNGITKDKND